ncbi:thermonuclease family protein [Tianweitania sp. BSSL-BM11]|uniref:Thermonuclease family protein n=1 Tax=Tianweitania aestuarii TaxID=2814886 RepID=A0ABS5RXJ3_9HYPH|nr:thermonuclease family protein [Tianweitania aestuarii]MBS9721778.1 thermonuclease family protein [Tianweitania aestuarii]
MQRRLGTTSFTALVGGGLILFCAAIFASGLHIKAREASPSVTVDDVPFMPDSGLDDDDAAAMAAAAGIETPPDDGGAVLPFEPETTPQETVQPSPDQTRTAVPDDWKPKLLYRPTASAAGRIEAQGYQIAITGIEPMDPDESCGEGANAWPCGTAARTQFRQLLRGRALTCTVPEAAPAEPVETACSVGGDDVGAWLAAQGWARASEDGVFSDAGEQARDAGRGIYGAKPVLPAIEVNTRSAFELPLPPSAPSLIAPVSPATQSAPAVPAHTEDRGAFPPAPPLPVQ